MSTKSTIAMYVTAGVVGAALAGLAIYCHVPNYIRIPCYVVMGMVIHIAWRYYSPKQ